MLGEVPGEFELGDQVIGTSKVGGEVELGELRLSRKNLGNLLGEVAVFDFFIIEEFRAF